MYPKLLITCSLERYYVVIVCLDDRMILKN